MAKEIKLTIYNNTHTQQQHIEIASSSNVGQATRKNNINSRAAIILKISDHSKVT